MDWILRIIGGFVLVCIIAFFSFAFFSRHYSPACQQLKKIAANNKVINDIWQKTSVLIKRPDLMLMRKYGQYGIYGPIQITDFNDNLGIDIKSLGLCNENQIDKGFCNVMIQLRNTKNIYDMDYQNFVPKKVDEIRFSKGYRNHIVFTLKKNDKGEIEYSSQTGLPIYSDIVVECEN